MRAVDHVPFAGPSLPVDPQPADTILWRMPGVEEEALPNGLAGVARLCTMLDGRESVPWIGFERPLTGSVAQLLGSPDVCVVEVGSLGYYRMLARAEVPDARLHRMTPACSSWIRSARSDETFTAFEAAAHIVLWLQQQIVVPELELRPVYDHTGPRLI